ncbi:hypothetical protein FOG18_07850 [Legionella israelensis]|uniref:hypothetical protein n=1 Tax=Legionella israelensis TaxID=454 RepID=UPI00117C3E59|nr:hypothetical protein [Legionella israelensis]QDP72475.1 hypothetical protein FOG18_07850 [Legionella israelensis]
MNMFITHIKFARGMTICLLFFFFLFSKHIYAQKIVHDVDIKNKCRQKVYDVNVKYGEIDYKGNLYSTYSGSSYYMYMEIPEMAYVSWKDSQRKPHKEQIPIISLLTKRDMRIRNFEVRFILCDDKLKVYYYKPIPGEELNMEKKEIWPEQKYIGITPE